MENYESLGTIGEGTYGVVLKCRHKITGQIVAIKKFKESDDDEQVKKTALREIKILKQLQHENIVSLLEVFRVKGKLYLVFEFVEKTILEEIEKYPEGLDPGTIKRLMWQLIRAIHFCHQHNIIHRDIKPENLLVSRNGVLKLCDFGFARPLAGPGAKYTEYVSTRWYRAPELLVGDVSYGKAVDVWSIGCMFAEITTGLPLFPGDSDIDQLYHIIKCLGGITPRQQELFKKNSLYVGVKLPQATELERLEDRFPQFDKHALDFLLQTIKDEPLDRWTCGELLKHPFFDNACDVYQKELDEAIQRDSQETATLRKKRMRNSSQNQTKPPPSRGNGQVPGVGSGKSTLPLTQATSGLSVSGGGTGSGSSSGSGGIDMSKSIHHPKQNLPIVVLNEMMLPTLSPALMTPSSSFSSTASTASVESTQHYFPTQQQSPYASQAPPWRQLPSKNEPHQQYSLDHSTSDSNSLNPPRVSMTSHGGRPLAPFSQIPPQPSPFQSFAPPPKPPPANTAISLMKHPYGHTTPTKPSRVFPIAMSKTGQSRLGQTQSPALTFGSSNVAHTVSNSLQTSMDIYSPKKSNGNSHHSVKKSPYYHAPPLLPTGYGAVERNGNSGLPSPHGAPYIPPKTSHSNARGGGRHRRGGGNDQTF